MQDIRIMNEFQIVTLFTAEMLDEWGTRRKR